MELWVEDVDYLRILEDGNFIDFVVMVLHKTDKLSVVKTNILRLKVSIRIYVSYAAIIID